MISAIMAAVTAPASDRTERYMDRVETHLSALSDARSRREFLADQIETWECRWSSWAQRVDMGLADDDDLSVTTFDFQLTVCALKKRLSQEPADA